MKGKLNSEGLVHNASVPLLSLTRANIQQVDAEVYLLCNCLYKIELIVKAKFRSNPLRLKQLLESIEIIRSELNQQHELEVIYTQQSLLEALENKVAVIMSKIDGKWRHL